MGKREMKLYPEERPSPGIPVPPRTFMLRIPLPTQGLHRKECALFADGAEDIGRLYKGVSIDVTRSRRGSPKEVRIRNIPLEETGTNSTT